MIKKEIRNHLMFVEYLCIMNLTSDLNQEEDQLERFNSSKFISYLKKTYS